MNVSQRRLNMVTEFACETCGSPAVVYPPQLSDDAPVACQRCGTVLCTLREFRLSAEQGVARMRIAADGAGQSELRQSELRSGLLGRLFGRLAAT